MSSTALVTGGAGFLGRHLVERLVAEGQDVAVWSRNPAAAALPAGVAVHPWPEPTVAALRQALTALGRPLVFHLAAAGVNDRAGRTIPTLWQDTIAGTARLVAAAAEAGAAGFVQAGSYAGYGRLPDSMRVREDAPLAASDLYGASKAAAGLWAAAVARAGGLGFAWVRIFAAYGPGEGSARLFPHLHARLKAGAAAPLTPGLQLRDWIYAADVAGGLQALSGFVRGGGQGVFNLCTGQGASVRECALLFARLMGAREDLLQFGALPARPEEPEWLVGDPTALTDATGWRARWSLEDGLRAMLADLERTK